MNGRMHVWTDNANSRVALQVKSGQFKNGSLVLNCQYLHQFFNKYNNQGQFQNQLLLRIPKLSLVVTFDKEMTEILTVHTPPEAMLRKIKCPGQTANAEGSQLLF